MTESFIGTFPNRAQFDKARVALEGQSLSYRLIAPEPGFGRVGVPSLVLEEDTHRALHARCGDAFTCAGWVMYRPATIRVPEQKPAGFSDDRFGQAAAPDELPGLRGADLPGIRREAVVRRRAAFAVPAGLCGRFFPFAAGAAGNMPRIGRDGWDRS